MIFNREKQENENCPSCGGLLEVDYLHDLYKCRYCGLTKIIPKRKRSILQKIIAYKENKQKEEERLRQEDEKRDKKILLGIGIFLITFFVLGGIMAILESKGII